MSEAFVLSDRAERVLVRISGLEPISLKDPFWDVDLCDLYSDLQEIESNQLDNILSNHSRVLAENNLVSRNLNNLVLLLILSVEKLPRSCHQIHVVLFHLLRLSRAFLKWQIEHLDSNEIRAQFIVELPPCGGDSFSANEFSNEAQSSSSAEQLPKASELPERLVQCLIDICIELDLNSDTYHFHLEIISTLLILLGTQMYSSDILSNQRHVFLDYATRVSSRKGELLQSLLFNFIERLPENQIRKTSDPIPLASSTGLLRRLFLLPWQLYQFFFSQQSSQFYLADRSLLLLLVLAYQPISHPSYNTPALIGNSFQKSLSTLADDELLFQGDKHGDAISISFTHLYNAIASCIHEEVSLLLFYSFLHRNRSFREFVFAKSDVDGLLVPLLESLYFQDELSCNRVYMILIVLLILSQDSSFIENVHARVILPHYKERILKSVSLGSLMMILLFRLITLNLSKLRDPYLHSNCLATLSNMSMHVSFIHAHAAEKLVSLIRLLMRRYTKLETDLLALKTQVHEIPGGFSEQLADRERELGTFAELIRVLLEMIRFCVSPKKKVDASLLLTGSNSSSGDVALVDRQNIQLIYALLQRHDWLHVYAQHERFWDLVQAIDLTMNYFQSAIDRAQLSEMSIQSVLLVLSLASRSWAGVSLESEVLVPDEKFSYEEQERPEEFFLPYLWTVVYDSSGIKWSPNRIRLFSVTEHELLNSRGPSQGLALIRNDEEASHVVELSPKNEEIR